MSNRFTGTRGAAALKVFPFLGLSPGMWYNVNHKGTIKPDTLWMAARLNVGLLSGGGENE